MILTVTGHRQKKLGGYHTAAKTRLIEFATKVIASFTERYEVEYVITGMAIGWDQAVAHACIQLKVPFEAAVPFLGQECMWPSDVQKEYHQLLSQCRQKHVTCDQNGYAPWKLYHRNHWMVNEANHILALWDGSPGGTAACVAYAEKKVKPVTNVWGAWVEFNREYPR